MTAEPRVFSIAAGTPFLPALVDALRSGQLAPGIDFARDPLAWSKVTIYLPTRRAARTLRSLLAEADGGRPTILPTIKALGEFDEDDAAFDLEGSLDLATPIAALDRLLLLSPLVEAWKRRLPAHIQQLFDEDVIVPVSKADAIWLARDLARLMDDVEREGSNWAALKSLAPDNLATWWQVTLEFLEIVTRLWPAALAERGQVSPAAHRNTLIRLEAERLRQKPPSGPVVAAGSTGSIPATADLLAAIAQLPAGAVVLPGLDRAMSDRSWAALAKSSEQPAVVGHPQYGLRRLIGRLGVTRNDVVELGSVEPALAVRDRIVAEALRPAETTDGWAKARAGIDKVAIAEATQGITLIEAANEREEALAIACAIRFALDRPGHRVALVTADRALARRVGSELRRFDIEADDSGGTPLSTSQATVLIRTMLAAAFGPDDPVRILSLIKHPLVHLGLPRPRMRSAAETIELVALRGGTGRPSLRGLGAHFEERWKALEKDHRNANWFSRINKPRLGHARDVLRRLEQALETLNGLAQSSEVTLARLVEATIAAVEALAKDEAATVTRLYAGNAGEQLVEFLRNLVVATADQTMRPADWPAVFDALVGAETVKPRVADDSRVAIWGTLEARLQSVDTLILGGLIEGSWPRKARGDRFLSRVMRNGINLDPPEREIGLAAHDFQMAMGGKRVILTRSARAGDAPAMPSRWLQRFTTFIGDKQTRAIRAYGDQLLGWARNLDQGKDQSIARANYAPPLDVRPTRYSVTEIETLRRDPYAIYARRILKLRPIEPMIADPGARERGTLFHLILQRFVDRKIDPGLPSAVTELVAIGRAAFDEVAMPADVAGVWWPRFLRMAAAFIEVERERTIRIAASHTEVAAKATSVGATGVVLSGSADRIDVTVDGGAEIIDYKTGSYPSRQQAHTLVAPQLPLEAALLKQGAFEKLGAVPASDLLYVRLKSNGTVLPESILKPRKGDPVPADELGERAWDKLTELLTWFADPANAYRSRILPFKESDMDGDYDHLARVMEWSAGAEDEDEFGSGE